MEMHFSNRHNLPISMSVFLVSDDYDGHTKDPHTISATSLLKSTRQIVLYRRLPDNLITDVSDKITSRLGQAYHKAVEDAWKNNPQEALRKLRYPKRMINNIVVNPTDQYVKDNPDCLPIYLEQRESKRLGKWTITGQYDFIILGVLEDIKSTSVFSYINQLNVAKYKKQGSIYKWLNPTKITEDYMNINYIFTDWSAGRARSSSNYPPLKLQVQKIPLLEIKETEQFIKNKLRDIENNLDKPEEEIPYCSDDDLWRKEDVYKYFSKPTNKSSSKNFSNKFEAQEHLMQKGTGEIRLVKGEVTACKYCAAFSICSQKDHLLASGELKL